MVTAIKSESNWEKEGQSGQKTFEKDTHKKIKKRTKTSSSKSRKLVYRTIKLVLLVHQVPVSKKRKSAQSLLLVQMSPSSSSSPKPKRPNVQNQQSTSRD